MNGSAEKSGHATADGADEDAARVSALRVAADIGWKDLDEGRSRDVDAAELESFLHSLDVRSPQDVAHDR